MPTNKLHFTIHQTYDLNTQVDKITVLGIRTPSYDVVSRYVNMWNWKKVKFNFANFRLACVSQLPVDPLGVGFEAGQIAPQELVNPMLFKTVTGDTLDAILDIIYNESAAAFNNKDTLTEQRISSVEQGGTPATSPLGAYYKLLGDDSFRQAHPQVGLEATHLVPIVREMLSVRPLTSRSSSNSVSLRPFGYSDALPPQFYGYATPFDASTGEAGYSNSTGKYVNTGNQFLSGGARPMPAFDISGAMLGQTEPQTWPSQVVAVCVMPPAIQKSLYYRCIVSWNITLSEFVPSFRWQLSPDLIFSTSYKNWMDVPVDSGSATAMSLMDDETGILVTEGVENVTKVTENLT